MRGDDVSIDLAGDGRGNVNSRHTLGERQRSIEEAGKDMEQWPREIAIANCQKESASMPCGIRTIMLLTGVAIVAGAWR